MLLTLNHGREMCLSLEERLPAPSPETQSFPHRCFSTSLQEASLPCSPYPSQFCCLLFLGWSTLCSGAGGSPGPGVPFSRGGGQEMLPWAQSWRV
jgi:hypothetical protein